MGATSGATPNRVTSITRNFLARFPKIQRGQDRRKGSAQLVGEHGEKLVFCLVSGLGRVFGREHFLLGPLLLGEIAKDEHDAANAALAVADGRAAIVDRNFAAVFPNQQGVIRQTDDHAFPMAFVLIPSFVGALVWLLTMLSRFTQP